MEEDVRPLIYLSSVQVYFRLFELLCLSFCPFLYCFGFLSVFVFSSYSIYMTEDSV